ncbi:unnamed protein product [Lactuca virosa]|uniref:Uncharacterized protein n=1 Tax=Lactuca virosa TaxID=75947 RepID=A0AAU9M7Q2_9ASTR|nr:unnamed protein product [Lactuca virosa]
MYIIALEINSLTEGIRRIGNDADYFEFIETGYSDENGLRMNVFIDHKNEHILDWSDMEVVEDDKGHYSEQDLDDDNDSQLSDDIPYEHEADDYIPSLYKTIGDEFLHRVSVEPVQVDDPAQPVDGVQVDDPAPHVDDVQVDDPVPPVDDVQVDDHAQPVNDVHAQPPQCSNAAFIEKLQIIFGRNKENFDLDGKL